MNSAQLPKDRADFAQAGERGRDAALLRATTELFAIDVAHDRDEVRRYEQLALHFLPRVATEDRIFVAERLARCSDAPHAVVTSLARDVVEVASPVIRHSQVLAPIDLLSVIAATGAEHHRLIARRPSLSAEVARALRLTGDPAVLAYLDNGASMRGRPKTAVRAIAADPAPVGPYSMDRGLDHLDPWRFLGLDRRARVRVIAALASRAENAEFAGPRPDLAFRAILGAARIVGFARSGQLPAIVAAISEGLDLSPDLVAAGINDPGGELLAIMLKALRLDDVQAQQVFLLASPTGRNVQAFFPLSDLYSGMEPALAETVVAAWREATARRTPRHEPHLAENGGHRRPAPEIRRQDMPDENARRA